AAAVAAAPATTAAADASSDRFAGLERRAAAGDADAAAELGGLLGVCWRHSKGSAKQIEETVISGMAAGVDPPRIAGTPAPPELVILLLQQAQPELEQRCAGLDRERLWKDRTRAPALLERAADAGRVEAMLDYAQYAFVGYNGPRHMLMDADEVVRRKQKARAYLRQALGRGDARALFLLGDAYASGPLENVDPLQSYAYLSAFFRSPAAQEWPPRLGELYLQTLAQHLDAQQLAQAQAQGLQLYRDFEAGAPTQ
ncbi:hypothetical protein, partial [Tahibacter caeni]|uniref:hypothetical protein n=1 Tax=Tahibacter caeni TaxID=1453545 RepID=UPI002148E302